MIDHIRAGTVRALAVTGARRAGQLPDVPTMTSEGFDVVYTNWRGLLAPGGISEADAEGLTSLVTSMHESGAWKDVLDTDLVPAMTDPEDPEFRPYVGNVRLRTVRVNDVVVTTDAGGTGP